MELENKQKSMLTKRLQAVADLLTKGLSTADVGCDHGYVSIYLVQSGISPKVIAMDVNEGPLLHARSNIAFHGLKDQIEVRLSNGTEKLEAGEVDSMIIAGMGGRLMWRILAEGSEKVAQMKELVLQPQSDVPQFRRNLRENGLEIIKEDMILEDGKYYPMMCVSTKSYGAPLAEKDGQDVYDTYGELLLKSKNETLKDFLVFEKNHYEGILRSIPKNSKRADEIQDILKMNEKAFMMY